MSNLIIALKKQRKIVKICFFIIILPMILLCMIAISETLFEIGQIMGTFLRSVHEVGTICH